jgi:hypothetical protein
MRGKDRRSEGLFSYVRLEQRVPADHPLRLIRELVDAALKELSGDFGKLYAWDGRPGIPPERLLRALLLQAFYTVRAERQLMEQLDFTVICCSAGLSGCRSTIRCGTRRYSARTEIGCSTATLRPSSLSPS